LHPYTTSNRKNRIQDGSDGIGERPAIHHGDRRPSIAPRAQETGSIGLDLSLAHRLAFDDGKMCRPDLRFSWRPAAPRRQNGAEPRVILGLHEKFGEGQVRCVSCGRSQRELGIGGELDIPDPVARIRYGQAANFGVVFRRNDDFKHRGDRSIAPCELGFILAEPDIVASRSDAAGLVACRPYVAAVDIA
jgi:hypothetical protein